MKQWYVYVKEPTDFRWHHLQSMKSALASMAQGDEEVGDQCSGGDGFDAEAVRHFLESWDAAKGAVSATGQWDGSFRGVPGVFWLPLETSFDFGFAFKQESNGTTFVISPRPLPWLGEPELVEERW